MPVETKKPGDVQGDPNATPSNADQNQLLAKLVAQVTDLSAKLDAVMSGGQTAGDANVQGGGGPAAGPVEGGPASGAPGAPPNPAAGGGEPGDELTDEQIEQLINDVEGKGGAVPGAGAPPAAGGGEPPARREEKPEQAMGYAGGANTNVAQLSRTEDDELARLREENTQLKLSRDKDELKGKLTELRNKGVQLTEEDVENELRDMMALPAEYRPILLNRIEKNYRRAPVGQGVIPAVEEAGKTAANPNGITAAQNDECIRLARNEGLSYEAMHKKLFGRFPWEKAKTVL